MATARTCATGSMSRTTPRRSRTCSSAGGSAKPITSAAATSAPILHVVQAICDLLDRLAPSARGSRRQLISFVTDRPGHDRRYAIDASKLENELGWRATETFESGSRQDRAMVSGKPAVVAGHTRPRLQSRACGIVARVTQCLITFRFDAAVQISVACHRRAGTRRGALFARMDRLSSRAWRRGVPAG